MLQSYLILIIDISYIVCALINNLIFFYRQIVALLAQDINNNGDVSSGFIYPETPEIKIFLVDPLTLTSEVISICSNALYSKSVTLFTLRNQLYSAGEFKLITRFHRLNVSNRSMDTLVDVPYTLPSFEPGTPGTPGTTFVMSLPFYE